MVSAPPQNKKILIVDDESAILQTLRFNLERNGYAVATAGDGRTAIALAASDRPDLIIMDIMLPVLDGIEACKEIRKTSGVPIIMLTARDQEIDKVLALELGRRRLRYQAVLASRVLGTRESAPAPPRLGRTAAPIATRSRSATSCSIRRARSLVVRSRTVSLAPKEFSLLHVLMENRGRVVTRQTPAR